MLSQLRAGAAALRMSDPDFRQGYPFTVDHSEITISVISQTRLEIARYDITEISG